MRLRIWTTLICLAAGSACFVQADAAEPPLVSAEGEPSFVYPQRREVDGYSLIFHAPQIRAWPKFERFEASIALELTPPGGATTQYGTAVLTGDTTIDLARRVVDVRAPAIGEVTFAGTTSGEYEDVVRRAVTRTRLDVPLDLFLAYLAEDVLSDPPPPGFNLKPPAIVVRTKPTLLLVIDGEPVPVAIADTGLKLIVNASWPLLQDDSGDGSYYLVDKDRWLVSSKLERGWKAAKTLPPGVTKVPDAPQYKAIIQALPLKASDRRVPEVVLARTPTELIVTEGKAKLADVPETGGLQYVVNTESPLFRLEKRWYFLVAGRWFATDKLKNGSWSFVSNLPEAFEKIPEDHAVAAVRASVPGTLEARMAALEALLPEKVEVKKDAAPAVEVSYAGEPKFEAVAGTEVARAVNTGYDIIRYGDQYYLCYGGAWYVAANPVGPWAVTGSVPSAIYAIPPSSPAYNVTQVQVAQSTPTTVVYTYPPAYTSSVYVVYGVPYYGTGWYYPPYAYGGYYYPYYGSYGHGSWYNPATGGYGSRSVWYGPYGGYSYSQGYNPSTGRSGYVETAWDNDEWESHGETYNPRTGVHTETSRNYDEDKDKLNTKRTLTRGDESMTVRRTLDDDANSSSVSRETSTGGSSEMQRQVDSGTMTSSGSITTSDGRTYSASGEQTRSGGTTTISGDTGSMTATTERSNGRSVTGIEGSGGGQGVSISGQGPGRTTVGESGSGDLYAGHSGNVFKKTADGSWQRYENGGWSTIDMPDRSGARGSNRSSSSSSMQSRRSASTRDYSRLNRDYSARMRGNQQFRQRSGGMRSGGGRRR